MKQAIGKAYELAREQYAALGVDTEKALERLDRIAISLHCWQGDDVGGFETAEGLSGGGIQATGQYPGKARTADELRMDLDEAFRMIPGRHRLNLHSIYADNPGRKVERDRLTPGLFSAWLDWARARGIGMDFNPSFFSHPKASDGFTLSHRDQGIRKFWVDHGIACRRIAASFGKALGSPAVNNVWIPDGYKDVPADRLGPRLRLKESLDEIFAERLDRAHVLDSVEGKLFGIGSESYVVGSHEFYLAYAVANRKLVCLDAGHYHPTETIADKISSVLTQLDGLLLHVSRGVRWDSDHVVVLSDDLRSIAEELVRGNYLERVHIGLDYFDASLNRVAAWVIGSRNMLKALLLALLEPAARLQAAEAEGDFTTRLALLEESKSLPMGAVWDYHCARKGVPVGAEWLADIKQYENKVLAARG